MATRYTMEQDFYRGRLREKHGIDVMVPDDEGRTVVHDIIYEELCRGLITGTSKQRYLDVIASAITRGADSVIFGCTEVGLLIGPDDLDVPAFDTTELHARATLNFALN